MREAAGARLKIVGEDRQQFLADGIAVLSHHADPVLIVAGEDGHRARVLHALPGSLLSVGQFYDVQPYVDHLALEDAARMIVHHAFEQLAAGAVRHFMVDHQPGIGMLLAVEEIGAGNARIREVLVEQQRAIGATGGWVVDGRDIGTVVFPDADVKIFLDAKPTERVRRRLEESQANGERVTAEALAEQIRERDLRDRTRAEAPLTQAPDAHYLDSTGLTIEEVEEAVLRIVRARISNGKDFS